VRPVNPGLGVWAGEGRFAVSFWYYDQDILAAEEEKISKNNEKNKC